MVRKLPKWNSIFLIILMMTMMLAVYSVQSWAAAMNNQVITTKTTFEGNITEKLDAGVPTVNSGGINYFADSSNTNVRFLVWQRPSVNAAKTSTSAGNLNVLITNTGNDIMTVHRLKAVTSDISNANALIATSVYQRSILIVVSSVNQLKTFTLVVNNNANSTDAGAWMTNKGAFRLIYYTVSDNKMVHKVTMATADRFRLFSSA